MAARSKWWASRVTERSRETHRETNTDSTELYKALVVGSVLVMCGLVVGVVLIVALVVGGTVHFRVDNAEAADGVRIERAEAGAN